MRARALPGACLLTATAAGSAALVLVNDLWLKPHHPSWLSGKLSDVGLVVFLPLFVGAALEWGRFVIDRARRRPFAPSRAIDLLALGAALAYFVAVKAWPLATRAHVALLSTLVPSRRFTAVTDPTDLLCLPFACLAWWTMRRRHGVP